MTDTEVRFGSYNKAPVLPLDRRVELFRAWAANLRSGKWQQGREFLRHGDRYCCLGVLVDTMIAEGLIDDQWVDPTGDHDSDESTMYALASSSESQVLPFVYADMVALRTDGELLSNQEWELPADLAVDVDQDRVDSMVEANDDEHWDFEQIAAAVDGFLGQVERGEVTW